MALVEYTMSPNWFFAIQDLYNFGNDDQKTTTLTLILDISKEVIE